MEHLKKFIQMPLKNKIVTIVILIVIAIATIFGTTACSLKATDLEYQCSPNLYNHKKGVFNNE